MATWKSLVIQKFARPKLKSHITIAIMSRNLEHQILNNLHHWAQDPRLTLHPLEECALANPARRATGGLRTINCVLAVFRYPAMFANQHAPQRVADSTSSSSQGFSIIVLESMELQIASLGSSRFQASVLKSEGSLGVQVALSKWPNNEPCPPPQLECLAFWEQFGFQEARQNFNVWLQYFSAKTDSSLHVANDVHVKDDAIGHPTDCELSNLFVLSDLDFLESSEVLDSSVQRLEQDNVLL